MQLSEYAHIVPHVEIRNAAKQPRNNNTGIMCYGLRISSPPNAISPGTCRQTFADTILFNYCSTCGNSQHSQHRQLRYYYHSESFTNICYSELQLTDQPLTAAWRGSASNESDTAAVITVGVAGDIAGPHPRLTNSGRVRRLLPHTSVRSCAPDAVPSCNARVISKRQASAQHAVDVPSRWKPTPH